MSETPATPAAEWSVVQTDAGPVTLTPLISLRARIQQLTDWAANASTTSAAWRAQAEDRFAACGAILVPRRKEWAVPQTLQADVERAQSLVAQISENDQSAEALKQARSQGGVFHRIEAWRHERGVEQDRASEATELRGLLVRIAKGATETTVAEADAERRVGAGLESQAAELDEQINGVRRSLAAITQEVARREDSARAMGFDALYETAMLETSGASPVNSPLLLKSGEVAYLSVPASLSRMVTRTRYVGGSSGFSFPIGHTGIRYRVGSFSGQPVQQRTLTRVDTGTFVLTNQRMSFIGRTKSTSIPLANILHVEVYTDAVAVFQERRENPDFYLIAEPKRAVFFLNWVLGKHSEAKT